MKPQLPIVDLPQQAQKPKIGNRNALSSEKSLIVAVYYKPAKDRKAQMNCSRAANSNGLQRLSNKLLSKVNASTSYLRYRDQFFQVLTQFCRCMADFLVESESPSTEVTCYQTWTPFTWHSIEQNPQYANSGELSSQKCSPKRLLIRAKRNGRHP